MADSNRTCVVCGREYSYCPHCEKDRNDETWRMVYCSNDCREVFKTVVDYKNGRIDGNAANGRLRFVDLGRRDFYQPEIKGLVGDILSYQEESRSDVPKPKYVNNKFRKPFRRNSDNGERHGRDV